MWILFKIGNFQDFILFEDDDVLIVQVSECFLISSIELDGNKLIEIENLMEGLFQVGLSEGSVFQWVILDKFKVELECQYIVQGCYGVRVEFEVKFLLCNWVVINIKIKEGDVVIIFGVDIVGNIVFIDEELVEEFELKKFYMFFFFKGDDKYFREKLFGDFEKLILYYQDCGYVNFCVELMQVLVIL